MVIFTDYEWGDVMPENKRGPKVESEMKSTQIKQTGNVSLIAAIGVFLASVLVIPNATGQETGSGFSSKVLEEIIVTATKRGDQNIQDIAGAVSVLGGEALDDRGILDVESFAGSIPGLQFQNLGPGDLEYIIRGINGSGPAVVGSYFDEYVITANDQQDGGGKNAPIKLVDLERVEVLNGPQGSLYGANSMAGNIKFIPRKPVADEFGAYVNTDFSDTKEGGFNYTVSGAINVPVIEDVLALRIVGVRTDNDGWIDQPRLQNGPFMGNIANLFVGAPISTGGSYSGNAKGINSEETNGGRVMIRWTPDDRFTLDLMYLNQDLETGGASRFTEKGAPRMAGYKCGHCGFAGQPVLSCYPGRPSGAHTNGKFRKF